MKIAVSGKGGVGKSTVAAALALTLAKGGVRVLALDADPDANLASALGISSEAQKEITPMSRQIALIEERTGAKVNQYGKMFKLNPDVSDVADKYAYSHNGVELIVLGSVKKGGGGCYCPESTFIKSLVNDLVLFKNDALIMDMEAGIEHLSRATSQGVDLMLVVVEPGQRAVDCANTVIRMSGEIGVKHLAFVGNKVTGEDDERFLREALPGMDIVGFIPYAESVRAADRNGLTALEAAGDVMAPVIGDIIRRLQ